MSIIGEITDAIKGVGNFFRNKKKVNGWKKLDKNEVPSWVERRGHKWHNKHPVKHHELRIKIEGKRYRYRIYFRKAAHGKVIEEYYRKKKNID